MDFQTMAQTRGVVAAVYHTVLLYGAVIAVNRINRPAPFAEFMLRMGDDLVVVESGDMGNNEAYVTARIFSEDLDYEMGVTAGGCTLDDAAITDLFDLATEIAKANETGISWETFRTQWAATH